MRKGDISYMRTFPMDSWVPMALVYRTAPFVEFYNAVGQYIDFGTSFKHFGWITQEQN